MDETKFWHIDGQMYDFEPWRHRHPGGSYILDASRGTDCSAPFHTYHAVSNSRMLMNQLSMYWKGPSLSCPGEQVEDPMFEELRAVIKTYAKQYGTKAVDSPMFMTWTTIWMFVYCWATVSWVMEPTFEICALMASGMWFCAADGLHSGTHASLTYSQIGDMYGRMVGTLFCLPSAWMRQHVLGHHTAINVRGTDPDLCHHACRWHGWRTSPQQTRCYMYRFWRQYAPLNILFTAIVPSLLTSMLMWIRNRYPGTGNAVAWASGEKLMMLATYSTIVSGLYLHCEAHGYLLTFSPFALCGMCYYLFSQISHINKKSFEYVTGDKQALAWSIAQVLACSGDYSQRSVMAGLISIGLNNQAIHHLFPSVHHVHYPYIFDDFQRIVQQHMDKSIHCVSQTFWQSVTAHVKHLADVNDPTENTRLCNTDEIPLCENKPEEKSE